MEKAGLLIPLIIKVVIVNVESFLADNQGCLVVTTRLSGFHRQYL
jgi:hypothetical protein